MVTEAVVDRLRKQLPDGYQIVKNGEAPKGWFVAVPSHEIALYTIDNHPIGHSTQFELWAYKGKTT